MKHSFIQILLLLCFNYINSSILEQDGSVSILLEHALIQSVEPVFTPRGNVTIYSLRSGQSIVNQSPITNAEQIKIKELAANNQFYQLRSTVTANDGSVTAFISTVKACMLAEAELDDRLSVSIDYTGRVIAVSLIIASKSTCEGAVIPIEKLKQFTTSVYVRHPESGPIPDTATYVQKIEREKEARARGETKDNRSFFAKYWMYIVPVVIFLAITSATNPDAPQAGGR